MLSECKNCYGLITNLKRIIAHQKVQINDLQDMIMEAGINSSPNNNDESINNSLVFVDDDSSSSSSLPTDIIQKEEEAYTLATPKRRLDKCISSVHNNTVKKVKLSDHENWDNQLRKSIEVYETKPLDAIQYLQMLDTASPCLDDWSNRFNALAVRCRCYSNVLVLEHEFALNDAENMITVNPEHWKGYAMKASILCKLNRLDEARIALEESAKRTTGASNAIVAKKIQDLDLYMKKKFCTPSKSVRKNEQMLPPLPPIKKKAVVNFVNNNDNNNNNNDNVHFNLLPNTVSFDSILYLLGIEGFIKSQQLLQEKELNRIGVSSSSITGMHVENGIYLQGNGKSVTTSTSDNNNQHNNNIFEIGFSLNKNDGKIYDYKCTYNTCKYKHYPCMHIGLLLLSYKKNIVKLRKESKQDNMNNNFKYLNNNNNIMLYCPNEFKGTYIPTTTSDIFDHMNNTQLKELLEYNNISKTKLSKPMLILTIMDAIMNGKIPNCPLSTVDSIGHLIYANGKYYCKGHYHKHEQQYKYCNYSVANIERIAWIWDQNNHIHNKIKSSLNLSNLLYV